MPAAPGCGPAWPAATLGLVLVLGSVGTASAQDVGAPGTPNGPPASGEGAAPAGTGATPEGSFRDNVRDRLRAAGVASHPERNGEQLRDLNAPSRELAPGVTPPAPGVQRDAQLAR